MFKKLKCLRIRFKEYWKVIEYRGIEKTVGGRASFFVVFIKYYYDRQLKEDEIGRAYRVSRRDEN